MPLRRRWLRVTAWVLGSIVALLVVAWAALHLHTERLLQGESLPLPLATLPQVADTLTATRVGPLGRVGIVTGEYAIDDLRADPPESPAVLADRMDNHPGRRLLQVNCGECHGVDLAGSPKDAVPPLAVLRGYSQAQFLRLMHEGKTAAGVDSATGFMSEVARNRFTALTEEEVGAMKAFIDGM